jgi:hypothetical protein
MRMYYRVPGPLVCSEQQNWSIFNDDLDLGFNRPPGMLWFGSSVNAPITFQRQRAAVVEADVGVLFNSCRNPARGLTDADYQAAADTLKVEVAAIKAVATVETKGDSYDGEGRPRILYERHYFHRFTAGKYDKKYPDISNASSGGYGKFSAQYGKLERAYKLDADAALKSASWGRFQIMGANYVAAGYGSVRQFVMAQAKAESEHLKAFTNFVNANKSMKEALQKKEWAKFAKAYNGPKYKDNDYDTKMADAYKALTAKPASGAGAPAAKTSAAPAKK